MKSLLLAGVDDILFWYIQGGPPLCHNYKVQYLYIIYYICNGRFTGLIMGIFGLGTHRRGGLNSDPLQFVFLLYTKSIMEND